MSQNSSWFIEVLKWKNFSPFSRSVKTNCTHTSFCSGAQISSFKVQAGNCKIKCTDWSIFLFWALWEDKLIQWGISLYMLSSDSLAANHGFSPSPSPALSCSVHQKLIYSSASLGDNGACNKWIHWSHSFAVKDVWLCTKSPAVVIVLQPSVQMKLLLWFGAVELFLNEAFGCWIIHSLKPDVWVLLVMQSVSAETWQDGSGKSNNHFHLFFSYTSIIFSSYQQQTNKQTAV